MQKLFTLLIFLTSLTQFSIRPAIAHTANVSSGPLRNNRIGLGAGYSITGQRDEVEAPVNKYLNTVIWFINSDIEKGNFLHSFDINFFRGKARMATPHKEYKHIDYMSTRVSAMYALDYNLWGNRIFPGYLGGAFHALFHYTGINTTTSDFLPPPTGFGVVSLNLHVSQKWNINTRSTLILMTGFPVLGYAVRPPFAGADELWEKYMEERSYLKILILGDLTSLHNYQAVFSDLRYYYKITRWLSIGSGLGFDLSHIRIPESRTRKDIIFRVKAGIAFNF